MLKERNQLRIFALLSFCILCTLLSCQKNETAPPANLKLSYFPLKLNSRIIYRVDSTVYSDFNNSKTDYSFQLKDTVVSIVQSGKNSKTAFLERYKRSGALQKWEFQKIISRSVTELRAEEFIENRRYVRLVFPPAQGKVWNGHTYNNLGAQDYYYKSVDTRQTINGITFDSTNVVVQIDDSNLLREDYAEEVYAWNLGLVKKQVTALEKDFYTQKIKRGCTYIQQIISAD